MKKLIIPFILLLPIMAFAAPSSTVVQNLFITGLGASGCLTMSGGSLVATTSCPITTVINGITTSSFLFAASGPGLSVASSGYTITYTYSSSSLGLGSASVYPFGAFLPSSTIYVSSLNGATGTYNLYVAGTGLTISTGTASTTIMWTNPGYISTSTGLTTTNFATTSISQWNNDAGYTTSTGGTPGGSSTQIQYNSSGTFAGDNNLVFIVGVSSTVTSTIAYDNSTNGGYNTSPGTSWTFSHKVGGGDNRILFVAAKLASNGQSVTGITYADVPMTLVDDQVGTGEVAGHIYLFYLLNPILGMHNVIVSCTNSYITAMASSYYGAAQVAPEASHKQVTDSNASDTNAVVTLTDNAWVIGAWGNNFGATSQGTNTTQRQTNVGAITIADSGGAVTPASSSALQIGGGSGTSHWASVVASFAPAVTAASNGLLGIGTSYPSSTLHVIGTSTFEGGAVKILSNNLQDSAGNQYVTSTTGGSGVPSTTPFTIADLVVVSSSGALSTISSSTYYLATNPNHYVATSSLGTAALYAFGDFLPSSTIFLSTNTGNWAGTWQGVNSTTFYLASNPSSFISTSTFNLTGTANALTVWNSGGNGLGSFSSSTTSGGSNCLTSVTISASGTLTNTNSACGGVGSGIASTTPWTLGNVAVASGTGIATITSSTLLSTLGAITTSTISINGVSGNVFTGLATSTGIASYNVTSANSYITVSTTTTSAALTFVTSSFGSNAFNSTAFISTSTYNASITITTASPLGGGAQLANNGTIALTCTGCLTGTKVDSLALSATTSDYSLSSSTGALTLYYLASSTWIKTGTAVLTFNGATGTVTGVGSIAKLVTTTDWSFTNSTGTVTWNYLASSTWAKVANNLSDLNATATAWTNLGGGALGKLAVPASGIVTSNGSTLSNITDNSANWTTAYTQTERWNGGATDLVSSTGRTSLGLGDSATLASSTWAKVANNGSDFAATSTVRTNLGFKATSSLALADANGIQSSYGGSSPCSASQAVSTISAAGVLGGCTTFLTVNALTTSSAITALMFPFWSATTGTLTGTSSIQAIGGGQNTSTAISGNLSVGTTTTSSAVVYVSGSGTTTIEYGSATQAYCGKFHDYGNPASSTYVYYVAGVQTVTTTVPAGCTFP